MCVGVPGGYCRQVTACRSPLAVRVVVGLNDIPQLFYLFVLKLVVIILEVMSYSTKLRNCNHSVPKQNSVWYWH